MTSFLSVHNHNTSLVIYLFGFVCSYNGMNMTALLNTFFPLPFDCISTGFESNFAVSILLVLLEKTFEFMLFACQNPMALLEILNKHPFVNFLTSRQSFDTVSL